MPNNLATNEELFAGVGPAPLAQRAIFEALLKASSGELPINTLYDLTGYDDTITDVRARQQRLGPLIIRLNRRLKKAKLVVRPGRVKHTYCLVRLDKK